MISYRKVNEFLRFIQANTFDSSSLEIYIKFSEFAFFFASCEILNAAQNANCDLDGVAHGFSIQGEWHEIQIFMCVCCTGSRGSSIVSK